MISKLKEQASQRTPHILAVETSVVDLQYDAKAGQDGLKREFFSGLKELILQGVGAADFTENPRSGDMRLITAEDYDAGLIEFGRQHNLIDEQTASLPTRAQAEHVSLQVFGEPHRIAGGSLANTFHGVVNARIDGQKLAEGHFVTAVGDDPSGTVFADSLEGSIHCERKGRQMECHVYPIDGDRILIATPSKSDPAEAYISRSLWGQETYRVAADYIGENASANEIETANDQAIADNISLSKLWQAGLTESDRIMLGGFLFFTPCFKDVINEVVDYLDMTPEKDRPTVVLTAAAQAVAANRDFQRAIYPIVDMTNTVIHSNTGEFRRLMNMDTEWRKPFEKDFAGMDGQALEDAKNAHGEYKKAKDRANHDAINAAIHSIQQLEHDLRFVVTDGARQTFVIDRFGFQAYEPGKLDKSQIVNTVGAGDNFAAGFQVGDLYGLPHKISVDLGHVFAQAVIQQPGARLAPEVIEQLIKKQDPATGLLPG